MAIKTANVLARVEPEIKEKAETILSQLGVPASTVINMLYRQIIMTKSIPFSISVPTTPVARDEMEVSDFNEVMQKGIEQAKADESRLATEVFADLRREI